MSGNSLRRPNEHAYDEPRPVWESYEHHKTMMSRSDYPDVVAQLKLFFRDGQLKMNHVEFKGDIDSAFSAPVTSLSFMTLKAGRTKDQLEKGIQANSGRAWGQTLEDANLFMSITGATSSQVSQRHISLSCSP